MKMIYIVSQFPSLTETFIAREIGEIVHSNHEVILFILRPFNQKGLPDGLKLRGTKSIRVTLNIISLLFAQIKGIIFFRSVYFQLFYEMIVACKNKPSRSLHFLFLFYSTVWLYFKNREIGAQYIHAHFLHSEAIVAHWLSMLQNIPFGITSHVTSIRLGPEIIQKVLKDAKLVICDTNQTKINLQKFSRDSIHLIRNGIKINSFPFRHSCNQHSNPPLILAVGSLLPPKGFHILIKACSILRDIGLAFKCHIVGEGTERCNLENLIKELELDDIVELIGALDFASLREQYDLASVFIMSSIPSPSGTDGLPTVLIEAMALGIPIVATNHAGIPELVQNNITGLLVEPGNPKALAECASDLLTNQELCLRLKVNGRELVEREYNLRKNIIEFIRLIEVSVN